MPELDSPAESLLATRALRPAPIGAALSTGTGARSVEDRNSTTIQSTVCKADIVRDDLTGLYLGQYALGTRIGSGGMGKVFRARHLHLDRVFAIKFMSVDLSLRSEAQDRFEQETLALGRLQHPMIVNAVDAGCLNGLKYLVTEFIEGDDLAQLVQRRGRIPLEQACDWIRQVAIGLDYSHNCGFVHRDIKPSNLIVNHQGIMTILDFGLVRDAQVNHHLTDNREFLGTWDFLAPEQAEDASQVDHRCDIYSLGCTLVFLLSGEVPFSNSSYATPAAKLKGHLFDMPRWLQNPPSDVPPTLVKVLKQMLAKSPHQRYAAASDVVQALASFTSHAAETPILPIAPARKRPTPTHRVSGRMVRSLFVGLCLTCLFGVVRGFHIELRTNVGRQELPMTPPTAVAMKLPANDTPLAKRTDEPVQINSLDSFAPMRGEAGVATESGSKTPIISPAPPKRNRTLRREWYQM